MDGYNLFEPDLELDVNTIPYEDMGIQGVWPRKQRTPSDIFPANANLVARGDNNKARWCKADEDGVLYTHDIGSSGGGGGPTPENMFCDSGSIIKNSGSRTNDQVMHEIHTAGFTAITGYRFRFQCRIATDADDGDIQIWLQGYDAHNNFLGQTIYLLYEVGLPWGSSDYPMNYFIDRDTQLTVPINIAATWPGAFKVRMEGVCGKIEALGNGAMFYY